MPKPPETAVKFRDLYERSGLSMESLAHRMGYKTASGIQRYFNPAQFKKQYLPLEVARKAANALSGLGDPPIKKMDVLALAGLESADEPDHTKPEIIEALGEEYAAVPRWDMRASAGSGQLIPEAPEALHRILFRMQWLRSITRTNLENIFAVEVEGDSMEPTLRQGDIILVDRSRTDPGADSIFLLDDGELKVKRVQRDPRNGMLVIKSDNPHYEDFSDVPPENVRIVGRVFWVGRHF